MSELKTNPVNPHLYALVAGELSGDTLGAGLMKAILRHDPEAQFIGIGGPKMIKVGMQSAFDINELSVMGIFEVLCHLPRLLKIRRQLTKMLLKARPVVMIGIDAPDFNLTVERKLKEAGIKTMHYVSPSVWAWREKRIIKIKASCDEVLALLPFEKDFYDQHDMPCTYVGHTLANTIPLDVDQNLARERLGLYKNSVEKVDGKVLAILPGSRRGIVRRMLPLYARTARLLREQIKDLTFISVAPNKEIALEIKDLWLQHSPDVSITIFVGNNQDAIASADVCLLTCGTVAFETMLLKKPMVVAYRVSKTSAAIARKLLKINMFSLPNLLAKRTIVPELIQEDCTPARLTHECISLLTSDNLLMKKEFRTIHDSIRTNADELAARAVLRVAATVIATDTVTVSTATAATTGDAASANPETNAKSNAEAEAATTAVTEAAATEAAATEAAATAVAAVVPAKTKTAHAAEGYRDFVDKTKKAEVKLKDSVPKDSVVASMAKAGSAQTAAATTAAYAATKNKAETSSRTKRSAAKGRTLKRKQEPHFGNDSAGEIENL